MIDPSELRAPAAGKTIRLDEDFAFENRLGGLNDVLAKVTILAGQYRAQYEDATGTYFLGPKGCFRTVFVDSNVPPRQMDCGIYLPNAKNLAPRVYVFRNDSQQSADTAGLAAQATPKGAAIAPSAIGSALGGAIIDAIILSERDKPRFMGEKMQPPGPGFRARLKAE